MAHAAHAQEPGRGVGAVGARLVDALNWPALADDAQIGPRIRGQVAVADLLLVSKAARGLPDGLAARLAALSPAPVVDLAQAGTVAPLLTGMTPDDARAANPAHPGYIGWAHDGYEVVDRAQWLKSVKACAARAG